MPPTTPKNNISNGTLILNGDNASPTAAIILPEMQTGLNPNLLTSPPKTGPKIELIPQQSEPTKATDDLSELNAVIKGCRRTPPKVNPKPSEKSKLYYIKKKKVKKRADLFILTAIQFIQIIIKLTVCFRVHSRRAELLRTEITGSPPPAFLEFLSFCVSLLFLVIFVI